MLCPSVGKTKQSPSTLSLCIAATRHVSMESGYLLGNEAAVHLVVVLSDLQDSCQAGNGQVDAK